MSLWARAPRPPCVYRVAHLHTATNLRTIEFSSLPPEVVKEALKQNAAAVILAPPASEWSRRPPHADEQITTRLRDALSLIEVRVLDHIIVAGGDTSAWRKNGFI